MTDKRSPSQSSAHQVLRDRARVLARVPDATPDVADALDVVEFRLAHEHYALETRWVREIVPLRELTPLPGTPPFMRGIVNVRGQIVPVIDIKRFFDLPDAGLTDLHHIILVESQSLLFGVLADALVGVRVVPKAALQPSLPTLTGIRAEYLTGVTAERLVVLDAERLASDPAIIVDQDVDS